jgi:alpha-beta hydrolase superfamily lysophospholipase
MVGTTDFTEKELNFTSDNITLQATLTIPNNVKEPPIVLLLPGSGPTDRDENAQKGFHKFLSNNLKTIASHLARNGYASFRYDKRGVGSTKELESQVGFHDIVQDARSAVKYVSNLDTVDSHHIYILGHSEGGIVGTILSAENKMINGFIGIASPITPLDEEVVRQIGFILKTRGKSKEKIDQLTHAFTKTFELMRKYKKWDEIDPITIKQLFSPVSFGFKVLPAKTVKKTLAKQFRPLWFIQSFDYDFREIASKISCPVLLLFGEKDYQVPPEEGKTFEKIVLEHGGDVTLIIFPNLNHMLRLNPGPMNPKSSLQSLKNTLDSRVLNAITEWLGKKNGADQP